MRPLEMCTPILRVYVAIPIIATYATCVADAGQLRFGDIVVVQQSVGRITVIDRDSGIATVALEDDDDLAGLSHAVIDSEGRLLTATRSPLGIVRMDFSKGLIESVASGAPIVRPFTIAIDQSDNLLMGDEDGWIIRADLQLGTQQRIAQYWSLSAIQDIEVGRDGTIYLLDSGYYNRDRGKVIAINPHTYEQTVIAEGGSIRTASDMVIEPSGNILVYSSSSNFDGRVVRVGVTDGSQQLLLTTPGPGFMTRDRDGTVLIGFFNSQEVHRGDLATGKLTFVGRAPFYGEITGIDVYIPEPNTVALLIAAVPSLFLTPRRDPCRRIQSTHLMWGGTLNTCVL